MSLVDLGNLQNFPYMLYLLDELRVFDVTLKRNELDFLVHHEVLLEDFSVFGDTLNHFSLLASFCIARE